MREFGFTLDKFTAGLRVDGSKINQDTLIECFNMVARVQGLVEMPEIYKLITAEVASHPFPQVFLGSDHWILCTQTKIYSINSDWSLTLLITLSAAQYSSESTWQIADFFTHVILTNGIVNVITNQTTGLWEVVSPTSTMPTLGSVLNFNGQIVANPVSTWYDTTSNSLIWSAIGSSDFLVDQGNVKGYMPLARTGEVYKIMKLGEFIVAYGSGSITICKFHGTTLARVKTYPYGIASREAVGGNEDGHLFIDTAGNLRMINAELKMSKEMYQEFFEQMLGNEIVVSFNSIKNDFYISDGMLGYIKTIQGLSQTFQGVTGLEINAGVLLGFYTDLNDSSGYVTTDALDFGIRANKTVDVVEVGADASNDVYVAIDYKLTKSSGFETSDWVIVNNGGTVTIPVSGVEFRFRVKCDSYIGFKLNYILPRVKFDDKRFKRGKVNADTTPA